MIHLNHLEDPRTGKNIKHKFIEIIFIAICAVISGCECWTEIEDYSRKLIAVDIRNQAILKRYAQIDAYSQGKLKDNPLNLSARNMGKNDLWIAACASVLDILLLTTDNDFNHLDKKFLKLLKV